MGQYLIGLLVVGLITSCSIIPKKNLASPKFILISKMKDIEFFLDDSWSQGECESVYQRAVIVNDSVMEIQRTYTTEYFTLYLGDAPMYSRNLCAKMHDGTKFYVDSFFVRAQTPQEVVLNCSETGNEYMPIVCEGIIE